MSLICYISAVLDGISGFFYELNRGRRIPVSDAFLVSNALTFQLEVPYQPQHLRVT